MVEVIAELRWEAKQPVFQFPGIDQAAGTQLMAFGDPTGLEEFFLEFGRNAYDAGFPVAERLVPHGFPMIVHQPAYRFRPFNRQSNLFQVGPGLFTANAVPPYQTWTEFRQVIECGFAALLKSRSPEDKERSITSINLRYIDAFAGDLIEGHDIASFFENVLGFKLTLPPALAKLLPGEGRAKPMLQLQLPLAENMIMNVSVGEGLSGSRPAFILDMAVVTTAKINPSIEAVLQCLDQAHHVIHDAFVELTQPIAALMREKKEK